MVQMDGSRHGEYKKLLETLECQKLRGYRVIYYVVFSAHVKVWITKAEGDGVLMLRGM